MTSNVRSTRPGLGKLGTMLLFGACATIVAGCANGFGAPTRHAVANLQAAHATVGTTLQVQGLIIALPQGSSASAGGTAYLIFTAISTSDQPDEWISASVQTVGGPASANSSAGQAGATSAAASIQPDGSTTIPKKAPNAPGVATIRLALGGLTAPLAQGDSLLVSLSFKNSGNVGNLFVPVQGADAVGSQFLPSAPASGSAPSSGVDSPATSAPAATPSVTPTSSS